MLSTLGAAADRADSRSPRGELRFAAGRALLERSLTVVFKGHIKLQSRWCRCDSVTLYEAHATMPRWSDRLPWCRGVAEFFFLPVLIFSWISCYGLEPRHSQRYNTSALQYISASFKPFSLHILHVLTHYCPFHYLSYVQWIKCAIGFTVKFNSCWKTQAQSGPGLQSLHHAYFGWWKACVPVSAIYYLQQCWRPANSTPYFLVSRMNHRVK